MNALDTTVDAHPVNPHRAPPRERRAPARTAAEWVAAFADGWREPGGPDAFVEHFRALLSADVRLIQPQMPTANGYEAFASSFVRPSFGLIPDLHGDVERWAERDGTLYIELTLRGTLGRRTVAWRACDRVTLEDGLAVERESYFDPTPLLAAVARAPQIWPRFLRLQAARLRRGLGSEQGR